MTSALAGGGTRALGVVEGLRRADPTRGDRLGGEGWLALVGQGGIRSFFRPFWFVREGRMCDVMWW